MTQPVTIWGMSEFDFHRWYLGLTAEERARFASAAGTSPEYIRCHLIGPLRRRKTPRRELLDGLVRAAEGRFTREQLLGWFFPASEAA
jgi:hypothetical protein